MYVQPVIIPYEGDKPWKEYASEAKQFIRDQYGEVLRDVERKVVIFTANLRYTDRKTVYIVDVSFDIQTDVYERYYKGGVG